MPGIPLSEPGEQYIGPSVFPPPDEIGNRFVRKNSAIFLTYSTLLERYAGWHGYLPFVDTITALKQALQVCTKYPSAGSARNLTTA